MKRIIITGILTLCGFISLAQTIFNQQETKDRTMIQQIALQQTYLSAIKTGYKDTENGLNTVHDLKNGSFNLNQAYFSSLSQVSPAVKNNPKIKLIITYQQQILSSFDNEISWQKQQSILAADEISYLQAVFSNMVSQCTKDLDALNLVITPGQVQMKDAERIKHIDSIYAGTNEKYKFSQSFISNTHAFSLDRQNGKQDNQTLQKLYDLN